MARKVNLPVVPSDSSPAGASRRGPSHGHDTGDTPIQVLAVSLLSLHQVLPLVQGVGEEEGGVKLQHTLFFQ